MSEAHRALEQSSSLQQSSYSRVIVKNTFLEIPEELPPEPPGAYRSKSEPTDMHKARSDDVCRMSDSSLSSRENSCERDRTQVHVPSPRSAVRTTEISGSSNEIFQQALPVGPVSRVGVPQFPPITQQSNQNRIQQILENFQSGRSRAQALEQVTCDICKTTIVVWNADHRKFKGNDKQVVSPAFLLELGGKEQTFKATIHSKKEKFESTQVSFKKGNGEGSISLKCEDDVQERDADVLFRAVVINREQGACQLTKQEHNFARSAQVQYAPDCVLATWRFNSGESAKADSDVIIALELTPKLFNASHRPRECECELIFQTFFG